VNAADTFLQAYIDSILGNIITCESVLELRRHRRAITSDLVYYNEWAVRVLSPEKFRNWFVGQRARKSQIETRKQEQEQKHRIVSQLTPERNRLKGVESQLDRGLIGPLLLLRKSLESPPEDAPLRLEIAALVAERDALDMSSADRLRAELRRIGEIIDREEAAYQQVTQKVGQSDSDKKKAINDRCAAGETLAARQQLVLEMQEKYPTAVSPAGKLLEEQKGEDDLTHTIGNADRAAKSYATQSERAMTDFRDLGLSYNIKYQFAGIPGSLQEKRYTQERERLESTELPQYEERIRLAKQEAEQELREHVLHILRERIANAKDELQRMNDALRPLTFHGDRYQFRWYPADAMREYHDLIVDSQLLGAGSLFESEFYRSNQEAFDRFYEELTRIPQSDAERRAKERLTDYRTYLEYDIEVKTSDGNTSRLSRIGGETSGGETQTPFYVAVAASFVQLYHIMDEGKRRRGRPTIRLAVFDEAFNRMDQSRIGVALDMLQQFGLQVVTATPLERCEYLVPKICTNYVLKRVGEEILIDEYSNYAAKLEEMYGV
jgi:SbcC/RAD50-like, Walker B motif